MVVSESIVQRILEVSTVSSRIRQFSIKDLEENYRMFWLVYFFEVLALVLILLSFWAFFSFFSAVITCGIIVILINPFIFELKKQFEKEMKRRKIKF